MKQILTFLGLAYLISWTIWFPLYGHVFGLNHLPTLPFHHAIGGLGPLIASLLTTWIFLKADGVKQLLKRAFRIKPVLYLAIALLGPFLLAFMASVICLFVNGAPINLSGLMMTKEFPSFNLITYFGYNLLFFGLGEETGWRGFALPRLQNKLNALSSSAVLTVFWALWHLPLFLYKPGFTTMDFAGIFGWISSLFIGSILLTWLYNSSRASILICAVFHSTINMAFTAEFADKSIVNYMGFLLTVCGIITIILLKPKNLAKAEREKVEEFC